MVAAKFQPSQIDEGELYTSQQTLDLIPSSRRGQRVSLNTLRRYRQSGRLVGRLIGRSWHYLGKDIKAFMGLPTGADRAPAGCDGPDEAVERMRAMGVKC